MRLVLTAYKNLHYKGIIIYAGLLQGVVESGWEMYGHDVKFAGQLVGLYLCTHISEQIKRSLKYS